MTGRVIVILVLLWGCFHTTDAAAQVKESTTAEPFPLYTPLPGDRKQVKFLRVQTGQTFTITLPANPTTGYQWKLAKELDTRVLNEEGHEYQPEKPGRIGSGGREVWRFRALGTGRAAISMQYVRSWELAQPPADCALFEVIVLKNE
jgi:inhibitor of cysteine peptidase